MGGGDNGLKGIQRMAMQRSAEQWDIYKRIFLPYQQAMMAANQQAMEWGGKLTAAQTQQQLDMLPFRAEVERRGLEGMAPVISKYYEEALEGPDVEARLGEVSTDVSQVFKKARQQASRQMSRMGMMPGGERMKGAFTRLAGDEAMAEVVGRTQARRGAEQEKFGRLAQAMGYGGGAGVGTMASPWGYGTPGMQQNIGGGMLNTALGAARGRDTGSFGQFAGGLFGKMAGSFIGSEKFSSLFGDGGGFGKVPDMWASFPGLS